MNPTRLRKKNATTIRRLCVAALAPVILTACGSGATTGDSETSAGIESSFTLKMLRNTGENPFAQLAYECDECTFAQHAALEPPSGWTRAPAQVILPIGELHSTPSADGFPSSVDFVPEIPGDDFRAIATTTTGAITGSAFVGNGANGSFCAFEAGGSAVTATDSWWGAASGPGPDPADEACNAVPGATDPFRTKPVKVKPKPIR